MCCWISWRQHQGVHACTRVDGKLALVVEGCRAAVHFATRARPARGRREGHCARRRDACRPALGGCRLFSSRPACSCVLQGMLVCAPREVRVAHVHLPGPCMPPDLQVCAACSRLGLLLSSPLHPGVSKCMNTASLLVLLGHSCKFPVVSDCTDQPVARKPRGAPRPSRTTLIGIASLIVSFMRMTDAVHTAKQ